MVAIYIWYMLVMYNISGIHSKVNATNIWKTLYDNWNSADCMLRQFVVSSNTYQKSWISRTACDSRLIRVILYSKYDNWNI